ncbi:hypothetical protein HDU77_006528 [Chytriomyces hyalinus]|nr:hypothetical protein HDU77_006528 [Chytriomyces hyalinus]
MADFADDDEFADEIVGYVERGEAHLNSLIQERSNFVRAAISRGAFVDAVSKALEDPAVGKDPQNCKDLNLQVVMEALSAPRANEVSLVVQQLAPFQLDTLIKFVYRGMAHPDLYSASMLLGWHEKITEVTGLGSIVRVMTDRQTV